MNAYLNTLYTLTLDASFWLVIGLFIGGLFKVLIPTAFLQKHLSGEGFGSVIKAALLGAPLPLCSCGVIPAAIGLRESGASKSATTAFLVSTPETGVDSVMITYAMMGPFMAIARPIIALISAITAGTLVTLFDKESTHVAETTKRNCCSSDPKDDLIESCCSSKNNKHDPSVLQKIGQGIKYAFTDLFDNIIFWLVIGLLFAALVQTFVATDLLIKYGTGWTGMLVMLFVGIPMYVCATASTPLAAGFLLAGISPGAVIVFLLAGPATNMATLGVIKQHMGKRTMALYLIGIMTVALLSGFVVNYVVSLWNIDLIQHLTLEHSHVPSWIQILSTLLLFSLAIRSVFFKSKK